MSNRGSIREKCATIFSDFFEQKYKKENIEKFKAYSKIGRNIEKSIFNETIKSVKQSRKYNQLSWENFYFTETYKKYYIKVISNIKLNKCAPKVIQNIIKGNIKITDIVSTPHKNLDPELYEKRIKEINDKLFPPEVDEEKVLGIKKKGMFKCGRCKSTNTYHTQSQRSSSDEPMTTLVSCNDCSNVWKFR